MRLSQLAGGRSVQSKSRAKVRKAQTAVSGAIASAIDVLESRRLFSGETLSTAISPVLANLSNPSANSITLDQNFTNTNLPGTLATFNTSLGQITVALTDAATPLTVANFLSYVSKGAYTDTIFHRTASFTSNASAGTIADIIQGGGYVVSGSKLTHIPTSTPVDDEYTKELYGDVAGTLAMAKTSAANSATSEWYFNVHDNVSALDTPTNSSSGVKTSYTVFGKVLTGMNVVDEIAGLPTYNVSSSLNTVPVVGLTPGEAKKDFPITASNFVFTDSITTQPGVTYTVTSDNNALVTPSVSNGVLSFKYANGSSGTADITVVAKSLDGSSASTTFAVTVPSSNTSSGPTTTALTAPNVVTGTTASINVLKNDTDSLAALNQSSITIVTAPSHGTATINASTGLISYKPTAGYTGSDTLTYTVTDEAGTVSPVGTVTLNVVAAPVTLTIGTATARSLTFTQPGGAVGHLTIRGGTALITFSSAAVTTTTSGGVVTASGAGATIASIVITNTGSAASLNVTGAVALGAVSDAKAVSSLIAPDATLSGTSSFGSIGRLDVAAITDSTLSLGSGNSTLLVPRVTDTSVTSTGAITRITSNQWTNDNGGYYALTAPRIGRIDVTGTFADLVNITASGSSLASATIGQAQQAWTVAGSIGSATFASPAGAWSLTATGAVNALTIAGNLTSNISAASIGALTVTGATTDVTIDTPSDVSSSSIELGRLTFDGAVQGSLISTSGHLGSITAPSLATSNVSAGAIGSAIVAGAANTVDFTTNGANIAGQNQIGRFKIGGNFNSSAVAAAGSIGLVQLASSSTSNVTAASIGTVLVPGVASGTDVTTNGKSKAGLQIGSVRFGSNFSTGAVTASGKIGSFRAAAISGSQISAATVAAIVVPGLTNDGTFTTTANYSAGQLDVSRMTFGALQGSLVTSSGNIGTISAASLTGVQIYAGVADSISQSAAIPSSTSQFSSNAHINSIVLGKAATAFSNSIISADVLSSLKLGNINTSNNGVSEGVAAHRIGSIDTTLVPGGTLKAGPAQLKSAATLSAYEKAKSIKLGDFVVNLI
jgi:cyclophilin family peptidyl-prolyl cis-trans isomerase